MSKDIQESTVAFANLMSVGITFALQMIALARETKPIFEQIAKQETTKEEYAQAMKTALDELDYALKKSDALRESLTKEPTAVG